MRNFSLDILMKGRDLYIYLLQGNQDPSWCNRYAFRHQNDGNSGLLCTHKGWHHCFTYLLLLFSYKVVSDSLQLYRLQTARLLCPWSSLGKNTGVGCHFLLQGFCYFGLKLYQEYVYYFVFSNTSNLPNYAKGNIYTDRCLFLLFSR